MKTTVFAIMTATTMMAAPALANGGNANASVTAEVTAEVTASGSFEVAQNRTYLDVVTSLKAEGYEITDVSKTWLGRIKIVATSKANLREVIVSRTTGEVLSDVIVDVYAKADGKGDVNAGVTGTLDQGASAGTDADVKLKLDGVGISGSGSGGISLGLGN
jgi:hypothetical protein